MHTEPSIRSWSGPYAQDFPDYDSCCNKYRSIWAAERVKQDTPVVFLVLVNLEMTTKGSMLGVWTFP